LFRNIQGWIKRADILIDASSSFFKQEAAWYPRGGLSEVVMMMMES